MKRLFRASFIFSLFALLIATTAFADDRINMPPYHFGGNTLFCDQVDGCTLLDMTGKFLWNWPQEDIAAAFAEMDLSKVNTLVGEGEGTYGPMWLWVIPTDDTNGNKALCLQGFDEWGKQNEMCFKVTQDWNYQQAPLPNPAVPVVVADCSMWSVGDTVELKGGVRSSLGDIASINADDGTVFVDTFFGADYTAGCDQIKRAKT